MGVSFFLKCNNKGFSIIEVLIAASVFSIGFMAITAVLWCSAGNLRLSQFCDRAVLTGQETVEILSSMDIDDVQSAEKPLRIRGQILDWNVCGKKDIDKDGFPDFKTIEVRVYDGQDEAVLSDDSLYMNTYYRMSGY